MGLTVKCSTPGCPEIENLAAIEGGEGEVCPACKAEILLLVDSVIRVREVERDRDNERRRVE